MSRVDEFRCFVGGLSWSTDDQALESSFRQFGRILDAKVIIDRASGRSRGFGFVTFAEQRAMDDAIDRLHNKELDGRVVTVNKAMPKIDSGGTGGASAGFGDHDHDRNRDRDRDFDRDRDRYRDREYASGYSNGGGRDSGSAGRDDTCFRCGRPGHWARDCPVASSRDRYGGGGSLPRPDREFGFGGRYGDRGGSGDYYGDRYDRYGSGGGGGGNSGGGDDYGRERRYEGGFRDRERSSGGAVRYDGGYRDRPGPYGRAPHFERSGGPPPAYDKPRIRGARSYDRY